MSEPQPIRIDRPSSFAERLMTKLPLASETVVHFQEGGTVLWEGQRYRVRRVELAESDIMTGVQDFTLHMERVDE